MLTPSFNTVHGLDMDITVEHVVQEPTLNEYAPWIHSSRRFILAAGTLRLPVQMTGQTCVLLFSHLKEEMIKPDTILTLFGVFG